MPVDCQSCLLLNNWSTGPQGNSLTSPSRSGLKISSSAKKMKPFTRYDQYLGIKASHTNSTSAPELFRNSKVFSVWIPKAEHGLLISQQVGGGCCPHRAPDPKARRAFRGRAVPMCLSAERQKGGIRRRNAAVPLGWDVAAVYQRKAILRGSSGEEMKNAVLGWNYRGDCREAEFNYPSWILARTPGLTPLLSQKVPRGL